MRQEALINPDRSKKEHAIPENGLLILIPSGMHCVAEIMRGFKARRQFLFNAQLLIVPSRESERPFFIAGPAVGAPMAVIVLEKLIALGAKQIFVYGWCGSLSPTLKIGEILIPTTAVCDEGTSRHYPIDGPPVPSSSLRLTLTQGLEVASASGPIWSTDAPFRETRAKIEEYRKLGVLGVDMEFSALCTVALFRQIELAGAMLVSDEVWHDKWRPGYQDKVFRMRNLAIIETLVRLCQEGQTGRTGPTCLTDRTG